MQARHIESNLNSKLENVQIDFMDIAFDLHHRETESKKKLKSRRKALARRAIEMHMEQRKLEKELKECWEE